jgi:hypothetical protein
MTEEAPVEIPKSKTRVSTTSMRATDKAVREQEVVENVLKDERVIIRFIKRETSFITDRGHVMYGGMHEKAKRRFVVPVLPSGAYVSVLTGNEEKFLEGYMGLEDGALSVYKKVDNYWSNRHVELGKDDAVLDLSTPDGYISYKILLANKDFVARSQEEYDRQPKASYQFVIVQDKDKHKANLSMFNTRARAFKLFNEINNDVKKLASVVFLSTGRYVSPTATRDDVLLLVQSLMDSEPRRFVEVVEDAFFDTKVLLNRCVTLGLVRHIQRLYYLAENNQPLCEDGQDPTMEAACAYLNAPRHQEVLFKLQGKLNTLEK